MLDCGIIRNRPAWARAGGWCRDRRRGGIVELQVRVADLAQLTRESGCHGVWDPVITEIAAQHGLNLAGTSAPGASSPGASGPGASGSGASFPGTSAPTAGASRSGVSFPGGGGPARGSGVTGMGDRDGGDDAGRRRAGARLRRAVQIRDRSCTHPSCRARAGHTDQDHAVDHADGGPTTAANLGCCCRHDHRVKHDGGWRVYKPDPEVTVWVSPLGHSYVNTVAPIMPALPLPRPVAGFAAAGTTAPPPHGRAGQGRAGPGQLVQGRAGYGRESAVAEAHVREGEKWHRVKTALPAAADTSVMLPCGCDSHCRCGSIMPPAPADTSATTTGPRTTGARTTGARTTGARATGARATGRTPGQAQRTKAARYAHPGDPAAMTKLQHTDPAPF
jgi:hypothetical protein